MWSIFSNRVIIQERTSAGFVPFPSCSFHATFMSMSPVPGGYVANSQTGPTPVTPGPHASIQPEGSSSGYVAMYPESGHAKDASVTQQ